MRGELSGSGPLRVGSDARTRIARWAKGDRLKQLRAFCHTARLGSVSQAAEHLLSSQPAVSLQVRALETDLALTLFERRTRRLSLTPVGELLYQLAMPLVQGMDRLPDTFMERHHGVFSDVLRIGAGELSATHLLPRYLERFRQRHPGTRVVIRTGSGRERLRWIRDFEVDLAVAAQDVPQPDLKFHPVLSSSVILIAPEDHPLAGRTSFTVEELSDYPFVGHARTRVVRQIMDTIFRMKGVALDVVVQVDGWSMIKDYVASSVGLAFVPDLCLTEHDRVWQIPIVDPVLERRYGVITRRDGLVSAAAGRLVELMLPGSRPVEEGPPAR